MGRNSTKPSSVRREPDMGKIGRAFAGPGMDTRHWVSYGTVASVHGEDGTADYDDPNAILVTPAGVDVDVILEPSGAPVPCRYGIQAGVVQILTPIRAGDQVMVLIPDGDLAAIPEILRVIPGAAAERTRLPVEDDGLPVFKNDRCSIFARGVPIEIRTDGGGHLRVNVDGTIQLGGLDADQQVIRGNDYNDAHGDLDAGLKTFLQALSTYAAAIQSIADPSTAATTALTAAIGVFSGSIDTFDQAAADSLSVVVKEK